MSSKGWADPTNILRHKEVCAALRTVPKRRIADIAAEFNVSPQRISAIGRMYGIRRKTLRCDAGSAKEPKRTKLGLASLAQRNAVIIALYRQKPANCREIAELLNMKLKAVQAIVWKYAK